VKYFSIKEDTFQDFRSKEAVNVFLLVFSGI